MLNISPTALQVEDRASSTLPFPFDGALSEITTFANVARGTPAGLVRPHCCLLLRVPAVAVTNVGGDSVVEAVVAIAVFAAQERFGLKIYELRDENE
ncbi:hypothetical protein V6N13_090787 [Hibiscus sabdariffa]